MENNYSNPLLAFTESDWLPALRLLCSVGLISKKDWAEKTVFIGSVFSGLIEHNHSAEATKFLLDMGCDPFALSNSCSSGNNTLTPDLFVMWKSINQEMVLTVLKNTPDEKLKEQHKKYNFFKYALHFGHVNVIQHLAERGGLGWDSENKNPDKKIDSIEVAGVWQKINIQYGKGRPSSALAADIVNQLSERNRHWESSVILKNITILLKDNEAIWTPSDINNLLTAATITKNRGVLSAFTKTLKINWAQYAPPKEEEHPIKKAISWNRITEVWWLLSRGVSLIEPDKNGYPLLASMMTLSLFRNLHKTPFEKTKKKIESHIKEVFFKYPEKFGENTLYDAMIKSVVDKQSGNMWYFSFREWVTPTPIDAQPSFWWESLANGEIRLGALLKIKKNDATKFVADKLSLGLADQDPKKIMTVLKLILSFAANIEGSDEDLRKIESSLLPALMTHREKITWDNWSEDSTKNAKILCSGGAEKLGQFIWKEVSERRLLSVVNHNRDTNTPLIRKSHRI